MRFYQTLSSACRKAARHVTRPAITLNLTLIVHAVTKRLRRAGSRWTGLLAGWKPSSASGQKQMLNDF